MMDLLYRAAIFAQTNLQPSGGGDGAAPAAPAAGGGDAAAPAAGGGGSPQGSMLQTLIFFGIMIAIFYLLIFRPQQKKAKQHRELVTALKRGDSIITNSGIYGRIALLDDHTATIEVDKNVKLRVLKSHIAGLQAKPEEGGPEKDKDVVKGQQG